MKQVLLSGGSAKIEEVPAPQLESGQLLVRVAWSCVSAGTELVSAAATSKRDLVGRLRRNPADLKKAFNIFRNQGLYGLTSTAQKKLSESKECGYSCAGTVLEAAPGLEEFVPGRSVACAGAGYANHAEIVAVPRNLVVAVPAGVDLASASTVALGAIALQGVRRSRAAVGERVGVIGLGFLGQLTVQILKASGCSVFGMDLDSGRVALAKTLGLDADPGDLSPVEAVLNFSEGYGVDAVLITAATSSDGPLQLAMQMARRKGRVIVVGDVGLNAQRKLMYPKELDLLISTSYGPGRYDPTYEEEGLDYPYAYVRWTQNRNMLAYLELIAAGKLNLQPLTRRRLPVAQAPEAYQILQEESPRPYTVLLEYPASKEERPARTVEVGSPCPVRAGVIRLAVIGAGSFARSVHIPNLRAMSDEFRLETVVTRSGPTAVSVARQVGARSTGTDYREALSNPEVEAVFIATRHDLHAVMVKEALAAGKHVFVEKPLALAQEELEMLEEQVSLLRQSSRGCPVIFVGFNRRYSPYALRLRELIAERHGPIQIFYRMNAGYQPPEHWVHGPEGGGRVLGEACHIFDLFRFLVGAPPVEIFAAGMRARRRDILLTDNFTAMIRYEDGSVCSLLYTAQGSRDLPKEAMELHGSGWSFVLDDYKELSAFGIKAHLRTPKQDKGHRGELAAFYKAMVGELDCNGLWQEALEVTRTALEVDRQVKGLSLAQ